MEQGKAMPCSTDCISEWNKWRVVVSWALTFLLGQASTKNKTKKKSAEWQFRFIGREKLCEKLQEIKLIVHILTV